MKIIDGNLDTFTALVTHAPPQGVTDYIKGNIDYLRNNRDIYPSGFVEKAENVYNRYSSSDAIKRARHTLLKAGVYMDESTIPYYEVLQGLNLAAKQFIMGIPKIQDLYKREIIAGFPEVDASDMYDRLMNDNIDLDTGSVYRYDTGEEEASDDEFLNAMQLLRMAEYYIKQGVDFTNY